MNYFLVLSTINSMKHCTHAYFYLSVVAKYFGQGLSFICYFTAVQEKLLAVFPVNSKVNLPAVNKVLILTIISFHKKPMETDRNSVTVTTMNNVIYFYMYCLF